MVGNQASITEQFSTNQFQSDLVITLMLLMVIIVIDRILYS